MYSKKVTIVNTAGLHARPAVMFVQEASKFKSQITVTNGFRNASPKSILSIMTLEAAKGTDITIIAQGEDEVAAVNTLAELINSNFGDH